MSADFVDWPSIAADDFPFPQAVPTTRLANELSVMLVSPDPEIRGDCAYTAAARWVREGHLDDVLEALGDTAASRFIHPEVQARTFAPLILCSVLTRGYAVPGLLPKQAVPVEQETPRLGRLPGLAACCRTRGRRCCRVRKGSARPPHGATWCLCPQDDGRAERLPILAVGGREACAGAPAYPPGPRTELEQATGWLTAVAEALAGGGPGPVPVWAFNTFATLQSLHLHLARGLVDEDVPPHAEAVAARIADLLRLPYYWLA